MNESIGYTFQPQDAELIKKKMNGAASMSPLSSRALQILSLRLPSIMGGRPLASTTLMTPNVGGNVPTGPAGPLVPGGGGQGPGGSYFGGAGGGVPAPTMPADPTFIPGAGGTNPGVQGTPYAPSAPNPDPGYDPLPDPGHYFPGNW